MSVSNRLRILSYKYHRSDALLGYASSMIDFCVVKSFCLCCRSLKLDEEGSVDENGAVTTNTRQSSKLAMLIGCGMLTKDWW